MWVLWIKQPRKFRVIEKGVLKIMSDINDYYSEVLSLKEKAGCVLRWFSEGKSVGQVAALCGDNARDRAVFDTYMILFNELGLIEHVAPISSTFRITETGRYAIKMLESQEVGAKSSDLPPDCNGDRASS
jgi:hypothetical protein